MSKTCGFVGLGIMGEGMANCLLKAGVNLVVWNRSPGKAKELKAAHPEAVTVAESPAAVVASCEVTFCMLSTPDACKSVYEMTGGVLEGVTDGKCLVDCATLAVVDMQRLSGQVLAKGGRFLEAPVSGSKGPAAAGALVFLCGGDESLFNAVAPELEAMGKKSFYFGEVGAGTKMKLVVNMVMGTMMCAFGEGLELCSRQRLDQGKLLEVLDLAAVANPMFKLKGPKMVAGDHAPNFPLQHAHKDMRLAVAAGEALGAALPLSAVAEGAMKRACEEGLGDQDFSAVYESQKRPKP